MGLIKLERNLPLKAYPKEELNKVLVMDFLPWISGLLSLTDQKSADRLELALPAIKDLCKGMGFIEIKRMFTQYSHSQLNIEPIPNYFDRILLGKIVNEYKLKNKPPPKPEKVMYVSEDEKNFIMSEAIKQGKQDYLENGTLELTSSRYDYLDSIGAFQKAFNIDDTQWEEIKKRRYQKLKDELKKDLQDKKHSTWAEKVETKTILKTIDIEKNGMVIRECKKSLLKDYYNG